MKETRTTHWGDPNVGATNESGFTALPAGDRYITYYIFSGMSAYAYWWSATFNYTRTVRNDQISIFRGTFSYKEYGFSVRCVRD